jgi:O-antigen ligase
VHRARSTATVLPALIPGACIVLLAFQAGGFYPGSWAPLAAVAAIALALRVVTIDRPFAGLSVWTAVAAGALALLGAWMLLSAGWSNAPGRALVEFDRLLTYLLVLVLCGSLAPRESRLSWALRGVALAIAVICVVALITRLRPDIYSNPGSGFGRLDYPITYWNGLAILAGIGGVIGLHLSASDREPWPVRVLAAALPPLATCTVYFTLSRGGIFASAVAVVVYLVLGFSRATPGALLALAPATAYALTKAYDADLLVDNERFGSVAGLAQGREVATAIVVGALAAMALRALTLLFDRGMRLVPGPGRLPAAARAGAVAGALVVALVIALAAGAPAWAERQVDLFLDTGPQSGESSNDQRTRLTIVNSNGRVDHWNVALDSFRADRLKGSGAGTFQNEWNRERPRDMQVLDAHSLYLEPLGEMGLVGIALLIVALGALLIGLLSRLRGPDRPAAAAVTAALTGWMVHAGVDWDWELTSVSVWLFGLVALALARPAGASARRPMPRLLRLIVALAVLLLAISPATLWRSQVRLADAGAAFDKGDCRTTIDAALDSLSAVGVRAEPWELIAYCNVRLGQPKLAVDAAEAAVQRDPDSWEFRYALALVRGAAREDPRPAAAEALRLNPEQPEAQEAVKAFRTDRPRVWERRARQLPLYVR